MSFTMILHLKLVLTEQFYTNHGDTREFVKGPHPQGYIYDSNGNVIVGLLPQGPIPCETMTWDMEHMLDVQNFQHDEANKKGVTKLMPFTKQRYSC